MYSTLQCITNSGRQRATSKVCYSPAANNSTLDCIVNVRKRTYINLVELNLLGQVGHTLKCETRCFGAGNIQAICYPPMETFYNTITLNYSVASRSSLAKIPLYVGHIPSTDRVAIYHAISEDSTLPCHVAQGDQVSSTLNCRLLVNQQCKFDIITLDVGYTLTGLLRCVTRGEAFTDLACSVVTNTKVTTIDCIMHQAVEPDDSSAIECLCYRIAGAPAQVQPLLVIGGYRHLYDLTCTLKLPTPSIYDVLCCNHGTVDGDPTYTTLRDVNYLTLNIYNIGAREVLYGAIKQNGQDILAESINFNRNLWTVKFPTAETNLGKDYFITIKLKNIDKIIILDAVKGKLNLGY